MAEFHDHGNIELLENVPDADACARIAETFSQLCDGTRLRILYLLCHTEECVTNIAAAMGMSSPAVSHHLKLLKQADIITPRRIGKEMHYRLADSVTAKLVHRMIDDIFEIKH